MWSWFLGLVSIYFCASLHFLEVVDLFGLGIAYFLQLFDCVCPWLVTSMMVLVSLHEFSSRF